MWLNGVAIDPATSYSVTVNSFLASGGDNFREFADGTGKATVGVTDLQAMVDYMAESHRRRPLAGRLQPACGRGADNVAGDLRARRHVELRRLVVDDVGRRRRQGHRDPGEARRPGARHRDAGQHHRHRGLRRTTAPRHVNVVLPATSRWRATLSWSAPRPAPRCWCPSSSTGARQADRRRHDADTPHSVSVSFTAPNDGGSSIDTYRARCISDDGGITGYGDNAADPITVSGLTAGHRYRCSVKAHNSVGWGDYSVYSPWVELDTDVPGKPTGVSVTDEQRFRGRGRFHGPGRQRWPGDHQLPGPLRVVGRR